jgi:hypothetical protein
LRHTERFNIMDAGAKRILEQIQLEQDLPKASFAVSLNTWAIPAAVLFYLFQESTILMKT